MLCKQTFVSVFSAIAKIPAVRKYNLNLNLVIETTFQHDAIQEDREQFPHSWLSFYKNGDFIGVALFKKTATFKIVFNIVQWK